MDRLEQKGKFMHRLPLSREAHPPGRGAQQRAQSGMLVRPMSSPSLTLKRPVSLLRTALAVTAFVLGVLMLVGVALRLTVAGVLLWGVGSGGVILVGVTDTPDAFREIAFPYSVPLTLMFSVLFMLTLPRIPKQARLGVGMAALAFGSAAPISQWLLWQSAAPSVLAPMLMTGACAGLSVWAIRLAGERERALLALRKAVKPDAVSLDEALAEMQTRLDKLQQTQTLAQTQLRETAAQDERNRLARDLHDTIKQQLFSINMAAATAQSLADSDPKAALEMVQEVRNLAQQAQVEMKALLTQLRPQPLATVGLVQAIKDQLEALHFRSEVATELKGESLPDEQALPLGAQEAIFRVVQEALSNIARHARANTATVEIAHDAGALAMRISDDGQGFDSVQQQAGMGMANMRARVTELGGTLTVASAPGKGVTIDVRLPLTLQRATLPEVERHRRLEIWLGTAYANGVSFVFGMLSLLFMTGFVVGLYMAGNSAANATSATSSAEQPPLVVAIAIVLAIIAIPIVGIVLQVIVRLRRRRLARLADADPVWGNAFRHLLHIDDVWLLLNTVLIGGTTAWLGRGLVNALGATALGALSGLCLVITIWSIVRLARDTRALSAQLEQWATTPWLRGVLLQTVGLVLLTLPSMISMVASGNVLSHLTFTPRTSTEFAASFQASAWPIGLLPSVVFVIGMARIVRRKMAPTTLPVNGRLGVLNSDIALCIIIVLLTAGHAVAALVGSDIASAIYSIISSAACALAYGLTRHLSPLPA